MARHRERDRARGQIILRGHRKFLIRCYIGRGPEGKRRYSSRIVRGPYKTAERELTKALREVDTGIFIEPAKQSLREYLEAWLETSAKLKVSSRTLEDYRGRLGRDITPAIGHKRLDQLLLQDIQQVYADLQTRGLSPRTVRYTHSILKQALEKAVLGGLLWRNPAQHAVLPRQTRKEMAALSPQQVNRFLEVTRDEEWHALWAVLLLGGLRPGEALGLKWSDLDGARLRIVRALRKGHGDTYFLGDPKTERSRGAVLLPPAAIEALQAHRAPQARHILARGERYKRNDLIFANSSGEPADIAKIRRRFKAALTRCGLPVIRLYDSRHTHATLLLSAGENPKIVSERLGHTNIAITLDTYSHVLPDMQQASVERLTELLAASAR